MIRRDTTWAEACLLAALSMSAVMVRESVHSQWTSPVTALLPGLVLMATRSSKIAGAILALTIWISRVWLVAYRPAWDWTSVAHTGIVASLYFVSRGIRGPVSFAFLVLTAGWPPLWTHTEFGHPVETVAALGVLAVYLGRTQWKRSVLELRLLAGGLFCLLFAFGGTVHIPLMVVTLAGLWMVTVPLGQVE